MAFEERFGRLLDEHGAALGRLVAAYESDRHEREDLLQDILLAIWRALPSFRGESSERTFIYRVAHNRAITHRHRRRSNVSSLHDVPEPPDPRDPPDLALARAQQEERLFTAVRSLPAAYRQAVMLRLEGLSHREVAEVLGTSENNVAARLSRARKKLSALLAEERLA
ncbi:MAG TPA: RNA polymerase sigma factor [Gemmatimonadaceae bacterium]|nr:RNA polymerase sigma factor [Gemmatimonadaceae bacterium]